jgi:hypothetical protein
MSEYGDRLFPQHQELLKASAISVEVAAERGYVSVDTMKRLEQAGFAKSQRRVPGLLIPLHATNEEIRLHQYRPDTPRLNGDGKPVKYETPFRSQLIIDVPPRVNGRLADTSVPLVITEGSRKADAAVTAGLACVALLGVNGWTRDQQALPDWRDITLKGRQVFVAFDSDVMTKKEVAKALKALSTFLGYRGAAVQLIYLPSGEDGTKVGVDDYLAAGHSVDELLALAREPSEKRKPDGGPPPRPAPKPPTPVALDAALKVFRNWLHLDNDDVILTVAAAVVGNLAPGDPCWLLVVAPPSSAKTEVVRAIDPLPCVYMASTVTEAALLSGTSAKERAKDATGGLLRQVGEFGILCFKDFTSTLSQNKETAKQALSALREIYDGQWERPVGTDGGKMLTWKGKCGLVGAVTPNIDRYGQVVTSLGDRYLLLRLDAIEDQDEVVGAALRHDHDPGRMRRQLADAMTGLIASADRAKVTRELAEHEQKALGRLAIYTAAARTPVERDSYTGDLLVMPQAEGPGRLALALKRIYGGLEALGVDDGKRWRILARIARDCVPSVRTTLIRHVVKLTVPTKTDTIAEAVGMVKKTAERHLEDLALLKLVERSRESTAANAAVLWQPSSWLADYFPSETDKYPPSPNPSVKRVTGPRDDPSPDDVDDTVTPGEGLPYVSVSLDEPPPYLSSETCRKCGQQLLHPESIALGLCANHREAA